MTAEAMNSLGYEEYERLSEGGRPVPVFRELPGDLRTPVSAFLSLAARAERAFLLESVLGGERLARYSFLGRDPVARLEVTGGKVRVFDAAGAYETKDGLLAALRARLGAQPAEVPGLPRFTGGAVGYLTWDAARLFERLPDQHGASRGTVACFAFYDSLVAFDHVRQRLVLIALAEAASRAAFERAQQRLNSLEEDLGWERRPAATRRAAPPPALPLTDGAAFREAVLAAKEHIAKGDIFQVVLSRQHSVDCGLDPFTVYRALRMVNPSPYMYYLKEGETAIAGASPEMLVRVEGRRVETRPIAGTRPRLDGRHDEAIARELLADEKERAEHLMLVDLGRNDLGRVCRFGSVQVPELMKVEHYSHVAHIVSSVTGELAENKDALDALAATFPAGTLSGAPKIRAMQIIDALEPHARGLYGGALGYIDQRGNLDFCIAIRTLQLSGGQATLQAGAGIVADSDPACEERETEAKAQALFEALSVAGGLA
jgi:anthranilate synthase component 1